MDDEIKDEMTGQNAEELGSSDASESHSDYKPVNRFDAAAVHHLSGMYQNWFLDYASYVILERAVPHIEDGLKPVQRRILHSMKRMDDGRYNKVANIVGHTMQFHPHGDASIGDALVQMGQKDLLIDTQGNWGNILTGNRAAAPRYIEARLSKFALDTVFNPKTTEWQMSYDGRNKEPITLPVKYPLLLAQGAEGIAVGLSSKILPHNFVEICDAAIAYLHNEEFHLYPDFPTGGSIDVSKYNDGQRGGVIKVRAKIEKLDPKTLVIREIPYSKTTETLIDSILKAIDKGKIKARHVEDLTAAKVEIQVQLAPGVSSDKTLDALYAFSDCEINISPNCCVIEDNKPQFLTISDVLRHSTDRTKDLIRQELEIRKGELLEQLHFYSLEKIFIEERIYKDKKFEQAPNIDSVCEYIDERLTPFYPQMVREVTKDDILKLLEITKSPRRTMARRTKAADYGRTEMVPGVCDIECHLLSHTIEGTKNTVYVEIIDDSDTPWNENHSLHVGLYPNSVADVPITSTAEVILKGSDFEWIGGVRKAYVELTVDGLEEAVDAFLRADAYNDRIAEKLTSVDDDPLDALVANISGYDDRYVLELLPSELDDTTGLPVTTVKDSDHKVKVTAQASGVWISGLEQGDFVRIFDTGAMPVYQNSAPQGSIFVPLEHHGVYLLSTGQEIFKFTF